MYLTTNDLVLFDSPGSFLTSHMYVTLGLKVIYLPVYASPHSDHKTFHSTKKEKKGVLRQCNMWRLP